MGFPNCCCPKERQRHSTLCRLSTVECSDSKRCLSSATHSRYFGSLSGSKYFSTMDLSSGYWQVGVHPNDQHKTAFISHRGLFEFRVLPFGVYNAPATFERLMEFVLADLIGTSCLVYIDDIVIFSHIFEEHISRLTEVLTRLHQAGLKLKPGKCFLFGREIIYLGHVVLKEGIATDPSKTAAMDIHPPPQKCPKAKTIYWICIYYQSA